MISERNNGQTIQWKFRKVIGTESTLTMVEHMTLDDKS